MKKYETKNVTRSETSCVELACDLCGTKAASGDGWSGGMYEVDETEVRVVVNHKDGTSP
jgi:hypothetical protein